MIASDAYMLEHIYYQCILWTFCWKNSSVKTNLKQQLCTMAVCKLFWTEWQALNPLGFVDLEKNSSSVRSISNFLTQNIAQNSCLKVRKGTVCEESENILLTL